MPLTQLDENAALIVVDLQKGIVGMPLAHPGAEIVARSAELARAFRERGLPVVLVNVNGLAPGRTDAPKFDVSAMPPDFAELVPELLVALILTVLEPAVDGVPVIAPVVVLKVSPVGSVPVSA